MSRSRSVWVRVFLIAACLASLTTTVSAGVTGKLSGSIVNERDEPLNLVTVRVDGLRLGAFSNDQGEYFIIGVPAGAYTIRATRIGHTPFVASNVEIRPDFTTTVDIKMPSEAVEMPAVEVKAERPLLQKDATGTTRFLSYQDMLAMPTRGFRDAVSQQTGIVNYRRAPTNFASFFEGAAQNQPTLITRGGRANETGYYVDGFSQQDPLTGLSNAVISDNAVQEVVLLTGGFAPEYGRAMSGAVNVITRDGGRKYFGTVETVTDNLAGDWIGAPSTDYNIYSVSLGGPVLPHKEKLTFYLSSERRWQRDRNPTYMPGAYRAQLENATDYGTDAQGNPILPGRTYDSDVKPFNSSSVYALQGKLAWQLSERMTLRTGAVGSQDDWREYDHALLFIPEHMVRYKDRTRSYYGTLTNNRSARSFYTLGASYFQSESKRGDGVTFDDLTAAARTYNPSPSAAFDLTFPQFFVPSAGGSQVGQVGSYEQRDASYVGIQGSYTSQVTRRHQLKLGGDYQRHTLRLITIAGPSTFGGPAPGFNDIDGYGYRVVVDKIQSGPDSGQVKSVHLDNVDDGLDGVKHPKSFSLYAQDKFEQEGLIVNGGLRLDYFDVGTPALRNSITPLRDPNDPTNIPDSLEAKDLDPSRKYTRLSPRLGIAFPVDEKTILRFNYGQFYQQPNLRNLYVSYRYLQYLIRVHPYSVPLGNPNLRPEQTTAYEVGVARLLAEKVRLDITAYLKNVKDLVQIVALPGGSWPLYRNRDFGTIRGVDVGFTVRPVRHVGANLSYSLSSAQGTGSSSTSQFPIAWLGGNVPKLTAPLDFDQRHKIALNVDWALGRGEGPLLGRTFRPLENTSVNALFTAGSGWPYTPSYVYDEVGLGVSQPRPAGPLNSRGAPWNGNLDVKVTRTIPLSQYRLDAYVWVLNVMNARNQVAVYRSSGSAISTNWLSTADGQAYLDNAAAKGVDGATLYGLAENDPTNFLNPRLVRFGLRASF